MALHVTFMLHRSVVVVFIEEVVVMVKVVISLNKKVTIISEVFVVAVVVDVDVVGVVAMDDNEEDQRVKSLL